MAVVQPVPAVGGIRVAKRQPDIKIPMFVPPYTSDGNNALGFFRTGSLWPLYFAHNSATGNAFNYVFAESISPFAKGSTEVNHANAGLFLDGGVNGQRFGNQLILRSVNALTAIKCPIVDNVALQVLGNAFQSLQPLAFNAPVAFGGILGGPLTMADGMYTPAGFFQFYDCYVYNAGTHGAASYALCRVPFYNSIKTLAPIPTSDLIHPLFSEFDAWFAFNDSTLPGGFFNYVPRGCIPDTKNGINHFMLQTGADLNPSGLTHWQCDMFLNIGSLDPVVLDDPTLQTIVTTNTTAIQSTAFGWLWSGSQNFTYAPGQFCTIILMSPDCTKYALVQLQPQTSLVAGDVTTGSIGGGLQAKIDPFGNMYLIGDVQTRMDNSFSLSLTWQPVTLPTLRQPSFLLPNACGCNPLDTLGLEGIAKDVGNIYG